MRELNHWVLWTKDKAPHQINGKLARSNDPNTWSSFAHALKCFDSSKYQGIGFMFAGSGITGIDIDHCIEDGQLSTLAQEMIDQCNSYTEKSPSGTGIHIYMQGVVPKAIKKEIEMYSEGRYFTVTGDKLNNLNVEPRQRVLDQLYNKYARVSLTNNMLYPIIGDSFEPRLNEDEILKRAFNSPNGSKIKALYDGDLSKHDGDHSVADLALCHYLAIWLNGDFNRIDQAFRNSGLYRDKWNRQDYKEMTINKAISGCTQSVGTPPRTTTEASRSPIFDNISDVVEIEQRLGKYNLDDINITDPKYQHTYLVFKKMQFEKQSPISEELLSGTDDDIKNRIKDIYENEFHKSRVIKGYRYGSFGTTEYGDYIIREITYIGYHLIFIVSPFSIIFANYFRISESFPLNENCCLVDMYFDHKDFLRTYRYNNFDFKFINTFEPFMDFYHDHDRAAIPSRSTNNHFWADFYQYLNFNPQKGKYDITQLDSLIIVSGYRKIESGFSFFRVENHGIVVPTHNNKK